MKRKAEEKPSTQFLGRSGNRKTTYRKNGLRMEVPNSAVLSYKVFALSFTHVPGQLCSLLRPIDIWYNLYRTFLRLLISVDCPFSSAVNQFWLTPDSLCVGKAFKNLLVPDKEPYRPLSLSHHQVLKEPKSSQTYCNPFWRFP